MAMLTPAERRRRALERHPTAPQVGIANAGQIGARMLSEFASCGSLAELMRSEQDAIWKLPDQQPPGAFLNDCGTGAYLLALKDALVVPGGHLVRAVARQTKDDLPFGLQRSRDARPTPFVLTGNGQIFADSFMRSKIVPAELGYGSGGQWHGAIPEPTEVIEGTAVYRELVSRHFGHMLVDVPGRAWPAVFDDAGLLHGLPQVAFGINGLQPGNPLQIPKHGFTLLNAFGIDADRVVMPTQVTRVRRLIVPARIAPFGTQSGRLFNQLGQRAGDLLTKGTEAPGGLTERVFLSRSRLGKGVSRVAGLPEARIDDVFAAAGFTILHPQEMSLADQVHAVRAARQIGGVVGSQLHLSLFTRSEGVQIVQVRPAHWVNAVDHKLMEPLGGSVVSHPVAGLPDDPRSRARAPMNLTEPDLRDLAGFLSNL